MDGSPPKKNVGVEVKKLGWDPKFFRGEWRTNERPGTNHVTSCGQKEALKKIPPDGADTQTDRGKTHA